jgi:hypothetical protein
MMATVERMARNPRFKLVEGRRDGGIAPISGAVPNF